jgi:DNA recombination-dependent growth factor C
LFFRLAHSKVASIEEAKKEKKHLPLNVEAELEDDVVAELFTRAFPPADRELETSYILKNRR